MIKMIKVINKNDVEGKNVRYRFDYCISCGKEKADNLISINLDKMNYGTVICLCDSCLKELKDKLDNIK